MEELQLSIEERWYGLLLVKLGEIVDFLKLDIVEREPRVYVLRKIRKFIDNKVDAGGENEAFLMGLQAVIIGGRQEGTEEEDVPQYGDAGDESPVTEFEGLKLKFQEILDAQLKEVEQRYQQQTRGKKISAHKLDTTINPRNIIRIKDFKITGVISNKKDRLPYSSLNKQIDSALKKGYPKNNIIDGVISVITPSLPLR